MIETFTNWSEPRLLVMLNLCHWVFPWAYLQSVSWDSIVRSGKGAFTELRVKTKITAIETATNTLLVNIINILFWIV